MTFVYREQTSLGRESCLSTSKLIDRLCDEAISSLSGFTELCTLQLIDEDPLNDEPPDLKTKYPLIHAAISANSRTLNRLSIQGKALWGCQIRSYLHLHELELMLSTDLGGLSLILHHCASLRAFSLYISGKEYQLSPVLQMNPTALPELTSFKLITHQIRISEADHATISSFLENKKKLRRLDVFHDNYEKRTNTLLPCLPALPALEVLGLDLPAFPFDEGWNSTDMRILDQHIPLKVSALVLRVPPEWELIRQLPDQEWIDMVRARDTRLYFAASRYSLDSSLAVSKTYLTRLPAHSRRQRLHGPQAAAPEGSPRLPPASWVWSVFALA